MTIQKVDLSIRQIAAGVFLGNLLFGILGWIVFHFAMASAESDATTARINAQYNAMQVEQTADNLEAAADRIEAEQK